MTHALAYLLTATSVHLNIWSQLLCHYYVPYSAKLGIFWY